MKTFNLIFSLLFLFVSISSADVTGTYVKGPALVEGFNEVASSAGTTTLTKNSQTKQILTGTTTHTYVLPDATTLPLSRKFLFINKSTGTATIQKSGGGALSIISSGKQKEFHLRAAGSAAGTWDELDISGSGGGAWGGITGTLSDQTDLQTALNAKAPTASPTFSGTIGTPLTASRLLATDASGNLSASTVTTTTAGYLDPTSSVQTQLNGKLGLSNFVAKGDIVAGVSSGTVSATTLGAEGSVLISDPNNITNGIRWGNLPGQGNYIKNSQLESGSTTGWAVYADAAGTQPVDCTGGSPNTTIAASATSPLNGTYSLLATLNTGASRQGEGFSYAFSIPSKYSTAPGVQQIEFDFGVAGGTFVAGNDTDRTTAGDSTYTIWVYDVTNAQLIQPSTYRMYSNVGGKVVTNFQNNAGSTSYRLCVHKGTSTSVSGTNITVKFDDFRVNESRYVYGTPISDWQSYTPTFTGFGSVTNISFKSRRVGDSLEIKGYFTTGTNTATQAQITLGYAGGNANVTVDTTKIQTGSIIGVVGNSGSGSTYFGSYALSPSSAQNYFNIAAQTSTTGALTAVNGSTFANASNMSVDLSVPIQGWSSSVQQSDGYDGRLVSTLVNRVTSSQTISGASDVKIQWNSKVSDLTNSFDATTNYRFTVPSSGVYKFSGNIVIAAAASAVNVYAYLYKNNNPIRTLGTAISSTTLTYTIPLNGQDTAVAGDYYEVYVNPSSVSMNIQSSASINGGSHLSIEKLQSPQTMSATEVVAASYRISADKTPSVSNPIDYDTKIFDTHNAVTTGSAWKFTAPVQGLYRVTTTNGTSTTGGTLDLYVNGAQDRGLMSMADTSVRSASATVSLNAGGYISVNPDSASKTFTGTKNNTIYIERIK